jgi:hypothetical protein
LLGRHAGVSAGAVFPAEHARQHTILARRTRLKVLGLTTEGIRCARRQRLADFTVAAGRLAKGRASSAIRGALHTKCCLTDIDALTVTRAVGITGLTCALTLIGCANGSLHAGFVIRALLILLA